METTHIDPKDSWDLDPDTADARDKLSLNGSRGEPESMDQISVVPAKARLAAIRIVPATGSRYASPPPIKPPPTRAGNASTHAGSSEWRLTSRRYSSGGPG